MNQRTFTRPLWPLVWLLFHCTVAMLVASVLTVFVAAFMVSALSFVPRLDVIVSSIGVAAPFYWGPGAILGFLVNKSTRSRLACWVWLPGVVWVVAEVPCSTMIHSTIR